MTFIELAFAAATCLTSSSVPEQCVLMAVAPTPVTQAAIRTPQQTGQAVDVILSAKAALVWDVDTGAVLYDKNAAVRRPVASLVKLLSLLYIREQLPVETMVEIPSDVLITQRSGANIRLPVGHHAKAGDLMAASLIASANDAVIALAKATATSEADFVSQLNTYARAQGLRHTHLANATGLSGGEQYSTARDIRFLLTAAARDLVLGPLLRQETGVLVTAEGARRAYETTNQLLGTYLPVTAAKTGYTIEAGENLALITTGPGGQRLGAVILGSDNRFQDMKIVIEWIWRNFSWGPT